MTPDSLHRPKGVNSSSRTWTITCAEAALAQKRPCVTSNIQGHETLGGELTGPGPSSLGQSREEPHHPGLPFPDGSVPTVTSTAVVSEASGGLWMIIYRPGGGDKAVIDACLYALYGS